MTPRYRLAVAADADRRLRFAADELAAHPDTAEVRIVTPTKSAGDDFVLEYVLENGPGRAGLHRFTPLQLATDLASARLAASGRTPVSGVALEALALRSAHRVAAGGALDYFEPVVGTLGFGQALARTLAQLRAEAVRPDLVRGLGPSGSDLARLLGRYEDALEESGLTDPPGIFRAAATAVGDPACSPLAASGLVLIDVAGRNGTEDAFLTALIESAEWVVAVHSPHAGPEVDRLANVMNRTPEPLGGSDERALDRARPNLFAQETPEAAAPDSSLEFFSATDEGREAIEIARRIQAAARTGTPFDRVAILLRNPDVYQPLVEDALRRAGIPGHYTHGSVRPNPSGRALLALLSCAGERLSASRFSEYLSLGQVPARRPAADAKAPWVGPQAELFDTSAIAPPPPPEAPESDNGPDPENGLEAPFGWERLLVDAAVIGGHDRWARRLDGLAAELEARAREAAGEDEPRREYLDRQRERLEDLRRFALPVIDQLAALPESGIWQDWLHRLERLAVHTLRQPEHVLSVLAELAPMSDIGPVRLDEVGRTLTNRLSSLRNEPPDRRYGKVFVGTIPEAAGRSFDMVFLPGLAEGVFPRKSREDPLLLDEFRNLPGCDLPRQPDRNRRERFLMHVAAGAARNTLVTSYPRMDIAQGRSRVPSFYALDVLRAAEGRIPDLRELEKRATESSMSRLGWPSPVAIHRSVDDAEYDLATIATLMHGVPQDALTRAGGRGHYLIGSNDALARSLRTRARRWRNFWSDADGIVEPDQDTLRLLAAERASARSYSPTALQHFAACPYRFLLHAIHRLHPREEATPIEQLDPLTRGALFHAVLYRFLTRLRDSKLLPLSGTNHSQAGAVLEGVLDETADEFRERLAPAIDRIWENGIEDIRTDLAGWLRHQVDASRDDPDWVPRYFELAFGLTSDPDQRDPASVEEEAVVFGNVRLRGSIDMIEEHAGNGLLRITDHKTGRAPDQAPGPTGAGEVLQPMLYAVAAEAILGQPVAASGLAFSTQRGDFRRFEIEVNDANREAAERAIRLIDRSIADGFFPAAPRKEACAYCDYRIVCGPYEESRTARKVLDPKTRERMERLTALRRIP